MLEYKFIYFLFKKKIQIISTFYKNLILFLLESILINESVFHVNFIDKLINFELDNLILIKIDNYLFIFILIDENSTIKCLNSNI